MARAQRTKALKILKSRTFLTGYGVVVKLKCRHPAKQKVGCGRTSARNGAEDPPHSVGLLRACAAWPYEREAKTRDEVPSPHGFSHIDDYTLSRRCMSNECGIQHHRLGEEKRPRSARGSRPAPE
jgi:hypothetical protein